MQRATVGARISASFHPIIPGIGNIVNVVIRPNSVSFDIYKPEIMTVRVKDSAAVMSQRALFEVLWNAAIR